MADTETSNGKPPTDEGKKLVRANYADRAVQALPDSRLFTDELLKRLLGDYDPNNVSLKDMRLMRDDFTIKMALHYGKSPLIGADYTFVCDDPQIAAAAKENYDDIHVAFMKIALNKWDFGYQGCVKQFELGEIEGTYEDPKTGEQKPIWSDENVTPVRMGVPIPLPPEVTEPFLTKGRFDGITTPLARLTRGSADEGKEQDHVPVEWSLWFANEFEEEFRNYMGKSRLVPVYRLWYSYWYNYHLRDRHAEQDADPALQVWYPPGDSNERQADGSVKKISNLDRALEIGRALRSGSTIAWPSDVHYDEQGKATVIPKWRAEFLQGGENLDAFSSLLGELEVGKIRACLVPEQILIEAQKGSGARNVAATQVDVFMESQAIEALYLDSLRNKYYLRPWVEANFGKDAPPCRILTSGFSEEDMTLVTTLIEAAFTADPNALPINFEKLLEKARIDMYSKKEQEEREDAIAEAQAEAQELGPMPGEEVVPQNGNGPPGSPDATGLAATLDARRRGPRKYDPREVIHLSSRSATSAPGWARREGRRRDCNVASLAERMHEVVLSRYQDVFEAAAHAVEQTDGLELSVGSALATLVSKIKTAISNKVSGYRGPLEGEMASMYHASGAAELLRLGLSAESWDVGRDEIQDWAREQAGRLIVTIDQTVVDDHLKPWLAQQLQTERAGTPDFTQGIPVDSLSLAQQLTEKFKGYPEWMAERVVRTEAMNGYNLSAADMWERVGLEEVVEFDGLGGRTGQTDEECLRRNGQTVSLDQFRQDTRDEHPNGSLGAVPHVPVGFQLQPLDSGTLVASAVQSDSIYGVNDRGYILSQAEVGKLME